MNKVARSGILPTRQLISLALLITMFAIGLYWAIERIVISIDDLRTVSDYAMAQRSALLIVNPIDTAWVGIVSMAPLTMWVWFRKREVWRVVPLAVVCGLVICNLLITHEYQVRRNARLHRLRTASSLVLFDSRPNRISKTKIHHFWERHNLLILRLPIHQLGDRTINDGNSRVQG